MIKPACLPADLNGREKNIVKSMVFHYINETEKKKSQIMVIHKIKKIATELNA